MRTISLGTALALRPSGLTMSADEPPADEALEVIEVVAEPITEAERRAPTSFVSVIDLTERELETDTVTDLLAESVGVQVHRFGGLGAFSTISIRGSESNQVQLYIDEIPISQAQNETANLANLPFDSLERIEVYRGTVPVGFGGGGTGGVVNLVTRTPSSTPQTDIYLGYGSFQTRKVSLSHTRRVGSVDVLGHVTYLGSKGDFTFLSSMGTDKNPADDARVTRENNAFNSVAALLKASVPVADGLLLDLSQEFFFKDQGVPGPESPQFLDTSLENIRTLTYARLTQTGLADGELDVAGNFFGSYNREKFDDPEHEFGTVQHTRDQTGAVGVNTTGSYYGLPLQTVAWFSDLAYEIFSPFNETSDPAHGPDQTRLRLTVAVQDEISLLADRVLLVPTLRYQHLRDEFSGADIAGQPRGAPEKVARDLWSPSVGLDLRAWPWLSVRGNIGQFQRAPNFFELFGNTGTVKPNPKLKPETAINRDVGFVIYYRRLAWIDRVRVEYAYFNNDVEDLIAFSAVRPGQFKAQNFDGARFRGHETSLEIAALDHFRLDANYTRQDAQNLSQAPSEKEIPLVPKDEAFLRVEVFDDLAALYYEYNFIGESFTGPSDLEIVPSRDFHTIGISVEPLDWLGFNFEAANITDNDVRDLGDFPLPGRSFFGTVRLKF